MSDRTSIDQPDLTATAWCRVSGRPVYSRPEWCWISPQKSYAISICRIGDRIISLEPSGHVNLEHIRKGLAVFRRALADAPEDARPLFLIDDYSRITGATLNARTYIVQQMR
ncbi:MAG: hypothetical protein JJV98_15165, partial [Desulfosarcina sp.]|nr:hypothetical protein [Desulfobacterales bacterium]